MIGTDAERFWAKVEKTDSCWMWLASTGPHGYGQVRYQGTMRRAHRVAWLLTHGPIPEGMHLCHTCDVRLCVNPAHLFLGSASANMRDARDKGRLVVPGGMKLDMASAESMRRRYAEGGQSKRGLARDFNVSQRLVQKILSGDEWVPDAREEKRQDFADEYAREDRRERELEWQR